MTDFGADFGADFVLSQNSPNTSSLIKLTFQQFFIEYVIIHKQESKP